MEGPLGFVLGVVPFVLILLGYAYFSAQRHAENPKDKLMPNWSQLAKGWHDVTRLRATGSVPHTVTAGETLAGIARELELGDILRLGAGELRSGGQTRDSILADSVEAIIAAVYLDGGIDAARALVRRLLGGRLTDPTPETRRKDPKTRLQEHLQSIGRPLPRYDVVDVSGDQHDQTFRVTCAIGLVGDTQGEGASRRKAEQAAAHAMLEQLLRLEESVT